MTRSILGLLVAALNSTGCTTRSSGEGDAGGVGDTTDKGDGGADKGDDWGDEKGEDGGESECNNATAEGYRALAEGDDAREYILHVPTSYDGATPAPLVIAFHGFGGCAVGFVDEASQGSASLNEIADANGFLVAYPQGVARAKGGAEWDPGDSASQSIFDNDLAFTEQLISDIASEYELDSSRVYATGYSNGGMMAYGLACSRAGIIAAAGIMSGIMLEDSCDPANSTSIVHFHGTDDDVLPYDGSSDFQSVPDVISFWLDHNGIPSSSLVTTELNGGDVVRDEYSGGTDDTSIVLYLIREEFGKGGGHVWFSADIDGSSPNQILWDFLSAYRLEAP